MENLFPKLRRSHSHDLRVQLVDAIPRRVRTVAAVIFEQAPSSSAGGSQVSVPLQ